LQNWRTHLRESAPIVEELMKQGCTRGEALLLIEMSSLGQAYCEMETGLGDLSRALDALVESMNKGDGEEWNRGG